MCKPLIVNINPDTGQVLSNPFDKPDWRTETMTYACPYWKELEEERAKNRHLRKALQESIEREAPLILAVSNPVAIRDAPKPVVWVRLMDNGRYLRCNEEGKVGVAIYGAIGALGTMSWEWLLKDIAEVRVWQPPEPEHVWVYGVWEHPMGYDLCCKTPHGGNQCSNYTVEEVIAFLLKPTSKFLPLSRYAIDWSSTPTFGVRLLTEGEKPSTELNEKYAAFYNGKRIMCTINLDPAHCVDDVLRLLTPAKAAVTLGDLEVTEP